MKRLISLRALIILLLFNFAATAVASPITINWTSNEYDAVTVRLVSDVELIDRCLRSGLELKFRYDLRICKRRYTWFDSCAGVKSLTKSLRYNPINETYRLAADKFVQSKVAEARNLIFEEYRHALDETFAVDGVPLDYLADGDETLVNSRRSYISARIQCTCKGRYSKTLSELSYYLTFGLLNIGGFDTGWLDFSLR